MSVSDDIIGRDLELDEVVSAVVGARPFVLHGPPGSGKSALFDAVAARLARRSEPIQLTRVRLDPEFALSSLLEGLRQSTEPVDDAAVPSTTDSDARRVAAALRAAASSIDGYLVIEDLHWLAADLAKVVCRRIVDRSLGIGVITRQPPSALTDPDHRARAYICHLKPMGRAAGRKIVDARLGEVLERSARLQLYDELCDKPHGYPLRSLFWASALAEVSLERLAGDTARDSFVERLDDQFVARLLEGLDDAELAALGALAAGEAGCQRDDSDDALNIERHLVQALRFGLVDLNATTIKVAAELRELIDAWCQRHAPRGPLLAWQVKMTWGRFRMHGRLDDLLAAAELAGTSFDQEIDDVQEAIIHDIIARLEDEFVAFAEASELTGYRRCVEQLPGALSCRYPVLRCRLAQCYLLEVRIEKAEALFRKMVRMRGTRAAAIAFAHLQQIDYHKGHVDEVIEGFEQYFDETSPGTSTDTLYTLYQFVTTLWGVGDLDKARRWNSRGINTAREMQLPHLVIRFESVQNLLGVLESDDATKLEALRDNRAHLESDGRLRDAAIAAHLLVMAHRQLGDDRGTLDAVEEAKKAYKSWGPDPRNQPSLMLAEAESLSALGRHEEALTTLQSIETSVRAASWRFLEDHFEWLDATCKELAGSQDFGERGHRAMRNLVKVQENAILGPILRRYLPMALRNHWIDDALTVCRDLLDTPARRRIWLRNSVVREGIDCVLRVTGALHLRWKVYESTIEMTSDAVDAPFGDRLFGRPASDLEDSLTDWCNIGDALLDPNQTIEEVSLSQEDSFLRHTAHLYEAWREFREGSSARAKRLLTMIEVGARKDSLFDLLDGLLRRHIGLEPTAALASMLDLCRGLPDPPMLWLVRTLEARLADIEAQPDSHLFALRDTLAELLDILEHWRFSDGTVILAESGAVYRGEEKHQLATQTLPFQVLIALAAAQGQEPMDVQDLHERVWSQPYNPSSSDANVYAAIARLRRDLQDDEFVESRAQQGYRLTQHCLVVAEGAGR
jgi:DNA-binding winged helix-turn-helix (wHTH) protein